MKTINLEIVIYIYFFITISIIIFNIFCVIGRSTKDKYQTKLTKQFKKIILKEIEDNNYNEDHYNLLCKRLKKVGCLMAYHNAIMEISQNNKKQIEKYLKTYKKVFIYLIQIYRNKNTIIRAYYAYLMYEYKLCSSNESNFITEILLVFTQDPSIYVRNNSIKALINFGNIDHIVKALKNINRLNYEYNKKVLTDDLLEFKGNIEKLCQTLVESLSDFNEEMQLGIINYIAFVSGDYQDDFYKILNNKNTYKEVKIAILRYFAKYPSAMVVETLYKYLNSAKANDWEFAAVSAFSLKNYKSSKTKEELIKALSNSNWYIRKNAAISLISIGVTKQDIQKINESNDKYAIEIFSYELNKAKRRN